MCSQAKVIFSSVGNEMSNYASLIISDLVGSGTEAKRWGKLSAEM